MIVWGGNYYDDLDWVALNDGGHYNPETDTWTPTATLNAPHERYWHSAVWTGTEMIIWGGQYDEGSDQIELADGARYWCEPD